MSQTANNNIAPLIRKLDEQAARYAELQNSLNDPAILSNPAKLVPITRESGQLEPLITRYKAYQDATKAAAGMGTCQAATQFLDNAAQHAEWAEKLNELAGAFESIGHCLADK